MKAQDPVARSTVNILTNANKHLHHGRVKAMHGRTRSRYTPPDHTYQSFTQGHRAVQAVRGHTRAVSTADVQV